MCLVFTRIRRYGVRRSRQAMTTRRGEVAEWSKAPHSKCGVRATVPWVRIPPSPPFFRSRQFRCAQRLRGGARKGGPRSRPVASGSRFQPNLSCSLTSRCRPSGFAPVGASHQLGRPLALRTRWVRPFLRTLRHSFAHDSFAALNVSAGAPERAGGGRGMWLRVPASSRTFRRSLTSRCRSSGFAPVGASHQLGRPLALRTPWVRFLRTKLFTPRMGAGIRAGGL